MGLGHSSRRVGKGRKTATCFAVPVIESCDLIEQTRRVFQPVERDVVVRESEVGLDALAEFGDGAQMCLGFVGAVAAEVEGCQSTAADEVVRLHLDAD